MFDCRRRFTGCVIATLASVVQAAEPTGTAVEFYNATNTHYFVTAAPTEVASLDSDGGGGGWVRTGNNFGVFMNQSDDMGLVPVCRFYGTPGSGINAHFYTANATECAQVQNNPAWTYEGIAFYVKPVQPNGSCASASTTIVYRAYDVPNPGHRFSVDLTLLENSAAQGYNFEGAAMCSPMSSAQMQTDVVRLLQQATFGPTDSLISHVQAVGIPTFLNEQFAATQTQYPLYPYVVNNDSSCVNNTTLPTTPTSFCQRDNYTLYPLQRQFFVNALNNPDQLRQRVAFALSQILVTSGADSTLNLNYAMRYYQQMFLDKAFGNYEDILTSVTLSPVMGDYLNMANNDKGNPATGTLPNENYARELMQLFSIGLWELKPDGTYLTDAQGNPIPTYGQDEIRAFARVFTGWTFPTAPGQTQHNHNPGYYIGQMIGIAANHDGTDKILLNGTPDSGGKTMSDDLAFAIHNVFMHPNVGPFISKQLIQKLVTGNPTPQYVGRISAVFNDNGQGVRGDMRAVVNAILTDPEARGALKIDSGYGKLREPVLYVAALARATNTASDGDFFINQTRTQGQYLFYAPTVFNYYSPDYMIAGTSITAPEFQIQDATTSLARINYANSFFFNTIAPNQFLYGATGTQLNLATLQALAGNPGALVDELNQLMMNGTMSDSMRSTIITAINAVPGSDTLNRARTALYLVAGSPQFQVQR